MSLTREQYSNLEADMISDMLEENNRIRDLIEEKNKKAKPLTYVEKKLILTELRDIEDIQFLTGGSRSKIVFHFKPISLYLDPGNRNGDVERRKLPFYYLWKLGFIDFKTSKSRVTMDISYSNDVINLFFTTNYDNNRKKNFHDWDINCWGGWGGVIQGLIKEKKFYDAVLHIASRMKQATVNDGVSSYEKMCQFEYEKNPVVHLNNQEVEFFIEEIKWLIRNDFDQDATNVKRFQQCEDNPELYYVNLTFKDFTYKLIVSNGSKIIIEGR